jgi:Flp pilus assembly protein TadD
MRARQWNAMIGAVSIATVFQLSACASLDPENEMAEAAAHAAQAAVADNGAPLRLARAARGVGDFTSAVSLYRSIIAANPSDFDTAVELGETQLEAGQIDDAIAIFHTVPANSKAASSAQLGLERAHLMLSQPLKAMDCADKAVALAPKDIRALIGRGVALDMLGRHAEAQASYRSALAIAPADLAARSDISLSLAMSGKFDEALAIMTPIARSPSATPRLRQNLALIYGLKGDMNSARALSLVDLDAKATADNLKFFSIARERIVK